jgi:hypothetical protein
MVPEIPEDDMVNKSGPVVNIVKVAAFGDFEFRFGKSDKVVKFPVTKTADGWKITDLAKAETPQGVLFVGRNGEYFVADFSRYSATMHAYGEYHGWKQKLGDEYADVDEVDDCLETVRELDGRLAEGKWTADREGFAGISVLMRAIMKVYGMEKDAAREFLKPLSAKEKQALRTCDELKAAVAEIEAEKGKGVDTAEILKKLPTKQ